MLAQHLTSLIVIVGLAALVRGFQEVGGSPCTTVGSACSWSYLNSGGSTVNANGFCAPNGFCGDNGATCSTSDNCYDYCGNGVCGGLGATCNTKAAFSHNQFNVACYTNGGYTCNAEGSNGSCVSSTSPASRRRARQQLSVNGPAACRRNTDTLCPNVHGLEAECVDLASDFENCGKCGKECGDMEGGATVECVKGRCLAKSCRRGWMLLGNVCVRTASS
ncbi:hypothetical protein DACRYDRAFT_100233 [Dacryopinax primogenitus]|uniref:Protein CPL1-like domain-containing protein n=1 Tax=Dacryopinax primogenitus (strain DJM 731) TaxID=1858805 RepID=M5G1E6_DACPD|nr:uncharacterized protein DACRYDRAFT_100233 [Dacryopinax primogenitus]EJU02020.1 hypothetical protein DACRYDRAFT_100233 [Dacryopinax primogenitus]